MNDGLKVFLAVTTHGNFTRAAGALHLTQPAVSQHIRSLEAEFGAVLIERNNRSIRLTRAGEIVQQHAQKMVQTEQQLRRLVVELSNSVAGALHIGASYSIGEYVLPAMLAEFCKQYDEVEPEIQIGNTKSIAQWVGTRALDIGLVEGTYSVPDVETHALGTDEMVLVGPANHPLASRAVLEPDDVASECWILREEGSGTREVSDSLLVEKSIKPRRVITFSSTQAIKAAVQAGLGISLLSKWTVRSELQMGELSQLRLAGLPITRKLFIVAQPAIYQPKVVSAYLQFSKDYFFRLKG